MHSYNLLFCSFPGLGGHYLWYFLGDLDRGGGTNVLVNFKKCPCCMSLLRIHAHVPLRFEAMLMSPVVILFSKPLLHVTRPDVHRRI